MIHNKLRVVIVSEPSLPPLTDLKEKKAHSPSLARGARKAIKSRGLSLPSDLVPSSSEASIIESTVKVMAPHDLGTATLAGASETQKGK